MKRFVEISLSIVVILGLAFILLRAPDTDPFEMKKLYGTAESQQVSDGISGYIHYRDQGPENAPVLLLLHGSNSSLHTWEGLVDNLVSEYRLISFDQHGYGITGPNPNDDYSASAKIDDALKVLDHVGVDRAVWVGNSMGGWLAWRAALAVPDRVSALVLIDASGAQVEQQSKPYLAARLMNSWIGKTLYPYITPRALVRSSIEENYADHSKVSESLVDRYWQLLRYPGNRRAAILAANTNRQPEKWNQIESLTLPTLILWGEQDSVIPISHAQAFKQKITNSTLITYPNAGHLPMEETPDQVAADIASWLMQIGLTN